MIKADKLHYITSLTYQEYYPDFQDSFIGAIYSSYWELHVVDNQKYDIEAVSTKLRSFL